MLEATFGNKKSILPMITLNKKSISTFLAEGKFLVRESLKIGAGGGSPGSQANPAFPLSTPLLRCSKMEGGLSASYQLLLYKSEVWDWREKCKLEGKEHHESKLNISYSLTGKY